MIKGCTITVKTPSTEGVDRFNEPIIEEYTSATVDNVVVAVGATADLDAARPDGVTVAYTLHFPKTWSGSLRGCLIELPEPWANTDGYRVIGDPKPLMEVNTPGAWYMPVEVEACYG